MYCWFRRHWNTRKPSSKFATTFFIGSLLYIRVDNKHSLCYTVFHIHLYNIYLCYTALLKLDCSDDFSTCTMLCKGMRSDQTTGNSAYTADKLDARVGSALNWIHCSYVQTPFILFYFFNSDAGLSPACQRSGRCLQSLCSNPAMSGFLSMLYTLQETTLKLDVNRWWSYLGGVVVYLFSSQLIVHFGRECICNRSITVLAVLCLLSAAWVCGRSLAGIVGSNPTGRMDAFLFWMLCVVRVEISATGRSLVQRSLADCVSHWE